MSDDIRPTNQIIYAIDIYDVSHALLVDANGRLKVNADLVVESIEIGTVDQGAGGASPWLVHVDNFPVVSSTTATVTAVTVGTSSTPLLGTNLTRKGFSIQCKDAPIYVILGSTASTSLYSYYVLKLNVLERVDYLGPIAAVVDSGTATVLVTELN